MATGTSRQVRPGIPIVRAGCSGSVPGPAPAGCGRSFIRTETGKSTSLRSTLCFTGGSVFRYATRLVTSSSLILRKRVYGIIGKSIVPSRLMPSRMARIFSPSVQSPMPVSTVHGDVAGGDACPAVPALWETPHPAPRCSVDHRTAEAGEVAARVAAVAIGDGKDVFAAGDALRRHFDLECRAAARSPACAAPCSWRQPLPHALSPPAPIPEFFISPFHNVYRLQADKRVWRRREWLTLHGIISRNDDPARDHPFAG